MKVFDPMGMQTDATVIMTVMVMTGHDIQVK